MKKFVNHVDHVVYLSRWETVDANIASLEAVTGARLERCERRDMGALICVDWSAGLEVVAPLPERTAANGALCDRLDSHGEGLLAVVYGVADLEAEAARLEAAGFAVGPPMASDPIEPWYDRLVLRERFAPSVMGSWMVFSQIDYADDVVRFVDVREAAPAA
ncbi:VOC family protein [Novosphingobium soli]|uniref:VOC family protein n=1 Tax=Novosphingobium soli TaxID=574956 RepID=A0ABV6CZB6_9SPHN